MKVLASDYDGTLRVDGVVSKEDLDALKAWREAGNVFGIVTGRSTKTLHTEIKEHEIGIDFIVCNNGGVVLDKDFNVLELSEINFKVALDILNFVRTQKGKSFTINDGHRRAVAILDKEAEPSPHVLEGEMHSVDDLLADEKVAQIVVAFDLQEDANALAVTINEKYGDYVEAYANVNCVDIVPKGVSKATGVAYIVDALNYNTNHVYTIGDSYNDLTMLNAYHGATLHHAVDEIKEKREYVVKDVKEFVEILMKQDN